ncbi:hypothetical protein HU200_060879 [Digitaria exilis]|uniref:DUF1618 domain-containing protein n=1 Tax=Digitaria exilis TaxID=1010633 RepID=A0A835A9H4_9POAL|nr:hypothetical protein HU200_060879 [Digitaria exilis]
MDHEYVACLDPPLIPTEDCSNLSLSSVILDTTAYISADAFFNPTTAVGELSTGAPIQVSFCTARPPRLSYLCVHFPGPVLGPDLVISTHADRALLRVSIPGSPPANNYKAFDYFVLPKPYGLPRFRDQDASIVSCSGTRYVIAVLRNTLSPMEFTLQLYDSDTRRWISRNLPVHQEPERDIDLPIPDSDADLFFHDTTKAIALESTTPVLRDMPLPKPARWSRGSLFRGDPYAHRDISVVALPGQPQQPVEHSTSGSSSGEDYDVDCYWTATIWTMPVPIASWKDWRKDCTIDVANIVIDNPRHSELLLNALPNLTVACPEDQASVTVLTRLVTAYPILGLGVNGDLVIYLLSKVDYMAREGWVIAVSIRDNKLQGITKLDERKNFSFRRYYLATDIPRYLTKATSNGN